MTVPIDSDVTFALALAGARRRALEALWVLDVNLGNAVSRAVQPIVGQMRLTWWYDALMALRPGVAQSQPVLDALAAHVVGDVIDSASLAKLVEGWEALLDPMPLDAEALHVYADGRGATLFMLSARLLNSVWDDAAGRGWALADFALRCSDTETAARASEMALEQFAIARIGRLPRPLRALARLAAGDARRGRRAPRTIWRLFASIR